MRFQKHTTLPLVIFGMIAAGLSMGTGSPAANASPTPSDQTCIVRGSDGQVSWFGDPDAEMSKLGEDLAAVVADYPDNATGTAFCSHYEGLAVYLSSPTPALTTAIRKLEDAHPGAVIEMHAVAHSLNELMSTGRNLSVSLGLGDNMVGWGQ